MTGPMDDLPQPDPSLRAPEPNSAPRNTPAYRTGAARADGVPRMETVRITAPDLKRRAAFEKMRGRLGFAALGFMFLFLAVGLKLTDATVVDPRMPHRPERPVAQLLGPEKSAEPTIHAQRAMIVDRNGEILAVSLPTVALYADPREMIDTDEAAHKLKQVLPRLDEAQVRERLANAEKQFVYLARQLNPREQVAINGLGIPGIYFEQTERRRYPLGRTAAHVLGGVDVDGNGVAGVEKQFDRRLRENPAPLKLSLDVKVQAVVRDELSAAMADFEAIGACGIVMDVRTGEVLAMVSLPDYDANAVRTATPDERFNRAVTGVYEPGSTFKLQTVSMALDGDIVHLWDEFDAAHPIHIGRFTITDFEGKHRFLYLPEVLAYSSNLGAAHIADLVGAERQRAWLRSMGMFDRIGIELPEAARPLIPSAQNWREVVTMTVGFGHGIAVSPLHIVRGTAAIANGGVLLRPTILAIDPDSGPVEGTRVMQPGTSDTMRKLMRLVVTDGFGKSAEVPGYYPGGKTGTAEKVAAHGGYRKHTNVAAFMSVFPMNAPRYAVYMMLDEPHANASTHGYATAGWVAAPAAGRVIARIGPMFGMLPDIEHAAEINQALAIPLQPGRPSNARAPQTGVPVAKGPQAQPATPSARLNQTLPAISRPPANPPVTLPSPHDPRHEATLPTQLPTQLPRGPIGASFVPATVTSTDVGTSRLAPR
jgi:cell division protein FtsI (penicillin-binding protein 3)